MGALGPPPAPLSKNTAAGCEVGGSPGLARDTQNGGHCCFCIYSGPRMDDVTSSGSGKQSHESSMNRTSSEIINGVSALRTLQIWYRGAGFA